MTGPRYSEEEARRLRTDRQLEGVGGLFDFPTAPPAAPAEQRVLPIDGTIAGRYARWRATPDGEAAYSYVRVRALRDALDGARRLSVARYVEAYRLDTHRTVNNDFRSLLARELEDAHRELRGLFECRVRRSA